MGDGNTINDIVIVMISTSSCVPNDQVQETGAYTP